VILRLSRELAFGAFNPFVAVVMGAVVLAQAGSCFSLVVTFLAFVPLDFLQS
jgi:hypothetical protein